MLQKLELRGSCDQSALELTCSQKEWSDLWCWLVRSRDWKWLCLLFLSSSPAGHAALLGAASPPAAVAGLAGLAGGNTPWMWLSVTNAVIFMVIPVI